MLEYLLGAVAMVRKENTYASQRVLAVWAGVGWGWWVVWYAAVSESFEREREWRRRRCFMAHKKMIVRQTKGTSAAHI